MHDRSAADQRGYNIEALAVQGVDKMLLVARWLGAAIGVNLTETGLVEVDQLGELSIPLVMGAISPLSGFRLLYPSGIAFAYSLLHKNEISYTRIHTSDLVPVNLMSFSVAVLQACQAIQSSIAGTFV